MGKHGDGNMDETGETRGEPGGKPARGTGTCEEIDPRNFADDPKCIRLLRSPFRTVLIDKFLKADSVEIANRHFFTRSRRNVSFSFRTASFDFQLLTCGFSPFTLSPQNRPSTTQYC